MTCPSKDLPASERLAFNKEIAEAAFDESVEPASAKLCRDMQIISRQPPNASLGLCRAFFALLAPKGGRPFQKESEGHVTLTIDIPADQSKAMITGDEDFVVTRSLRRPRTGGFLAGRFYAATAGAFSASYASGER